MKNYLWWQKGIIYQIYPLSFQDSKGDGYGDIRGIINRVDYLKWLGINAVWLSPIYPSPFADYGYDVTDYRAINPLFGTMEDFDEMLALFHKNEIKVILDYVGNHTSEQHPWFLESRSSKNNPKRDWYIWRDPAPNHRAPNNWLSVFGGSAWEWDESTGQYYYHAFLKEQPDLNWRNPEVKKEMCDMLRFWFEKGVDGFRVDALWHFIKDINFRDDPINPHYQEDEPQYHCLIPSYSSNQPQVHEVTAMLRNISDEYNARLLIGEIYLPISELIEYYGQENQRGVHLPYNFQLIVLPWNASEIYSAINTYEGSLPSFGWPNWVLGNHDKPRIASRAGKKQARTAAVLLMTLRGTPTMYYGDEIGMENTKLKLKNTLDPAEKREPGKRAGRDAERTPMQWNAELNAGFTTGKPWLPVKNNERVNVESMKENEKSILNFYFKLIKLRGKEPAFQIGSYEPAGQEGDSLAFVRRYQNTSFLVAVNLGGKAGRLKINEEYGNYGSFVFGSHSHKSERIKIQLITLKANEAVILCLNQF